MVVTNGETMSITDPVHSGEDGERITILLDKLAARALRELESDGTKRSVVIRRALINELLSREAAAIARDPEERRLARETLAFMESLESPDDAW